MGKANWSPTKVKNALSHSTPEPPSKDGPLDKSTNSLLSVTTMGQRLFKIRNGMQRLLKFRRVVMRWLVTAILPAVASLMATFANAEERKLYEWTVYPSPTVGTINEVYVGDRLLEHGHGE